MAQRPSNRRVLFLSPYLGDGGINTHMLALGSELRELGWDVAMSSGGALEMPAPSTASTADGSGAPRIAHYERAGISHYDVSFPRRVYRLGALRQLLRVPLAIWQVLRTVRRHRPALIHSHSRQMGLYARVVQLLTGVPFVSTVHNPIPTRSRLWSYTVGSRAIAVSADIRDILIRDYAVDPDHVRVIPAGADADHFRPPTPEERRQAQERYGIGPGLFVLAFIGALDSNKRPDTLVEAVAGLLRSGRDVLALVAGVGSREEALRNQVARLGIGPSVRLLGYQDARNVLWASDVLVLPSESEGSPVVVAEAMLSGVVAMSTPAGAAQQLTPDVTGVVFGHGDSEELARKVGRLMDQPDLRATIAANGLREARDHFSSAGMARAVQEIYLEVTRQSR